jgi:hypothetical protein
MLRGVEMLVDRNGVKKEAMKILKYKELTIEIQRKWSVQKSDTSNNRGSWNHLKIIHKIPEQYKWNAKYQGTKETITLGTEHILRTAKVKLTLEQVMQAQAGSRRRI